MNVQCSTWKDVLAGASQATIPGLFFFLVYINDVPVGL